MFKHFLVLLDGSPLAECVLLHTIALAHVFEAQVTLLCMLEYPQPGTLVDAFNWQLRKGEAETYLGSLAEHLHEGGVPTRIMKIAGESANSVINYVHNRQVDLVILSSHGASSPTGRNLGSVVQNILLRSCIPTLLVHAGRSIQTEQIDRQCQRLFAPPNASPCAADVLPFGTTLAHVCGKRLLLIRVLCRPQIARRVSRSLQARASADHVQSRNYEEDVIACLHDLAEAAEVDLVVLSSHWYAAGSQQPDSHGITNFTAYGTTPFLVVQPHSADWTLR